MTRRAQCNSSLLWCPSTSQTELAAFDNSRPGLQKTELCAFLTQVNPFRQPGSNAIVSNVTHDLLLNPSSYIHPSRSCNKSGSHRSIRCYRTVLDIKANERIG